MSNTIVLNNISKKFVTNKKISVLNKISYKFVKGKIYSLVGPSGSGKSTLLNILSLIDKPSRGNIKIFNKEINYNNISNNDGKQPFEQIMVLISSEYCSLQVVNVPIAFKMIEIWEISPFCR